MLADIKIISGAKRSIKITDHSRAPPLMLSIVERALIAKRDKLVKQKDA